MKFSVVLLSFVAATPVEAGWIRDPRKPSSAAASPSPTAQPASEPSSEKASDPVALQLRRGLSKQHQRDLERYGESITIMVVGETGVGKTSLLSNILHCELDWAAGERTTSVRTKTVKLQLGGEDAGERGVPFEARLVDSPGWGDVLSLERSFSIITKMSYEFDFLVS